MKTLTMSAKEGRRRAGASAAQAVGKATQVIRVAGEDPGALQERYLDFGPTLEVDHETLRR